ncbi:MAG: hypothetical protein HY753_07105, partial [Nitrospirae bacterium]|nr:hypothetical protein [Nitrospirota bacterium]
MKKYLIYVIFILTGMFTGIFISNHFIRSAKFPNVIEKIKPSIVPIFVKEGDVVKLIGTGFIFSSRCYVITNAHITTTVSSQGKLKDLCISLSYSPKGKDTQIIIPCDFIKQDSKSDIAILLPKYDLSDLKPRGRKDIKNY